MKLKMWSKIRLNEIRRDARKSLQYRDENATQKSNTYKWFLYVLPIVLSITMLSFGVFIKSDIANYFITSISIFAGLFFSLLIVITDKYNKKKENLKILVEKEDDEAIGYLKRYKNFSIFLIRQISYTIILAGILILSMSIIYFIPQFPKYEFQCYLYLRLIAKYLTNGLIYYLGCQFIVFLLVILGNMYVMLLDDINFENIDK